MRCVLLCSYGMDCNNLLSIKALHEYTVRVMLKFLTCGYLSTLFNIVNIMVADALAPYVAKIWVPMIMTM